MEKSSLFLRTSRMMLASVMALSMVAMGTPLTALAQQENPAGATPVVEAASIVESTTPTAPTIEEDTTTPEPEAPVSSEPEGAGKIAKNIETLPPEPVESCVLVSDTQTTVAGQPASILSFIHSAWTTAITGASWIWGQNPVTDPTVDETQVFTRDFSIVGAPTTASVAIAADNTYVLKVNGVVIADHSAIEDNFSAPQNYSIVGALNAGNNTVEITVKNMGVPGSDASSNPAGLVFSIEVNGTECGPVPPPIEPTPTVTIVATDITCPNESDLPNWGAGGHTIGSSTASDFVKASNKACHTQSGWNFEWADQSGGDTADNFTGSAGAPYTGFGPTSAKGVATTTVPLAPGTTELHVRQVLRDGYIGFTHGAHPDNSDNYSAEFYCSTDGVNYDNWDFIRNPVAGTTYYCAAFNAPAVSTVSVCKVSDEEGNPGLAGWNVMLTGSHVEDISVDSSNEAGVDTKNKFAGPSISYLAKVSGIWLNQGGANPVDAEYSTTDSWATHMDGYTGYSNDILELGINDTYGNWGPYNSLHEYAQSFIQSTIHKAHFGIFDGTVDGMGTHTQNPGWFGDNSGELKVSLYHGYAGITGDGGCATFERVPYGKYTVGETPQDGWTLVSGGDSVTVDGPTETYTLVNHHTDTTPEPDPVTTTSNTIVVKAADLAANLLDAASNPSKWFFYNDETDLIDSAIGSFVTGPAAPVLGTGSAQMSVTGTQRYNLATAGYGDVPLSAVKNLSFDTYNASAGNGDPDTANHSGYLQFNVSFDGANTWQRRISYVPSNNTAGTIPQDSWKTWDAINGGSAMWSYADGSTNWPATLVGPHAGVTSSAPRSWADLLQDYPNIKMVGGNLAYFGVRVGEPYANGYTENVDNIVIGVQSGSVITKTSYDFEPTEVIDEVPPGGGSGGSGGRSHSSGGGSSGPVGAVLGAATTTDDYLPPGCGPLLSTYMKLGSKNNDAGEVGKLQTFLNKLMGAALPVTGFYGPLTKKAVTTFQEKYYADVLTPWAEVGKGLPHTGTGYMYKTTQRKINLLYCDSLVIPLPDVVND